MAINKADVRSYVEVRQAVLSQAKQLLLEVPNGDWTAGSDLDYWHAQIETLDLFVSIVLPNNPKNTSLTSKDLSKSAWAIGRGGYFWISHNNQQLKLSILGLPIDSHKTWLEIEAELS